MGVLFLLLLILVPPFISMLIEKKENGEPIVSGYSCGDDVIDGMIGDPTSSYYMMFDNDN